MKKEEIEEISICTTILTGLNTLWLYLYSLTGISFEHLFRFANLIDLITIKNIILLTASGAALGATIVTLHYLNKRLSDKKLVISSAMGVFLPFLLLTPLFDNLTVLFLMLMFYFTGLILIIYFTSPEKKTGILNRLKYGWNLSKKVIYVLGAGGLVIGILFTATALEQRQDQFKESMLDMTEEQIDAIEIEELLEDDIGDLIGTGNFTMTEEEFKNEIFIPGIKHFNEPMNYSQWESLDETQQDFIIESSYQRYKEEMEKENQVNLTPMLEDRIEEQMSGEIMKGMFEQIPMFRMILATLPLINGILISSIILLFGTLLISPFCALAELALPLEKKEEEGEEVKDQIKILTMVYALTELVKPPSKREKKEEKNPKARGRYLKHKREKQQESEYLQEPEKKFKCPKCGKAFKTEKGMKIHETKAHKEEEEQEPEYLQEPEKKFKCPKCGKAFKTEKGMKIHETKTHKEEER